MAGFLGFEKEDFTSIVDVGAAVFQLLSDIAFYDGSDDASGIHSLERDIGRNKVVSERRKQAIHEYYETEDEDEARNPKMENREYGVEEVEQFSTWATRDTFDDSLNTYETLDAPLLPVKNMYSNSVYIEQSKPKEDNPEIPKHELHVQKSVMQASLIVVQEQNDVQLAEKETVNESMAAKNTINKSAGTSQAREMNSAPTTIATKTIERSECDSVINKHINPKLLVGKKPSSGSQQSRTIGDAASVLSTPITKNESTRSKRLLIERAKAKAAKYNSEQDLFKVFTPESLSRFDNHQDLPGDPPGKRKAKESSVTKKESQKQTSTKSAAAATNKLSLKIAKEISAKPLVKHPIAAPIALPGAVPEGVSMKKTEKASDLVKTKSRDYCRGLVSERAAAWQQQCKANKKINEKKSGNRVNSPGKGVVDYDDYVKNFKLLHKREMKFL
jgi:hypothetical protein